jgi:hypothetical protein
MVMSFQYRGAPEEWSQQYHFEGSAPSDTAGWDTLIAALASAVKIALNDRTTIVRAYAYTDTSHDSVYTWEASDHGGPIAGLVDTSTAVVAPGDAAAWVRWKTSRTNTHGKPIYLRKYFHGCILAGTADDDQDSLATTYRSALQDFADTVQGTFTGWPGLAGPGGTETFLANGVSSYVTTRTLERRGPRP